MRPAWVGWPPSAGPAPIRPPGPGPLRPPGPAGTMPVRVTPVSAAPPSAGPASGTLVPAWPVAADGPGGWPPAALAAAAPLAAAGSSGRTARVAPGPGTILLGAVLPVRMPQACRRAVANSRQVPYRSPGAL